MESSLSIGDLSKAILGDAKERANLDVGLLQALDEAKQGLPSDMSWVSHSYDEILRDPTYFLLRSNSRLTMRDIYEAESAYSSNEVDFDALNLEKQNLIVASTSVALWHACCVCKQMPARILSFIAHGSIIVATYWVEQHAHEMIREKRRNSARKGHAKLDPVKQFVATEWEKTGGKWSMNRFAKEHAEKVLEIASKSGRPMSMYSVEGTIRDWIRSLKEPHVQR
jgi:hypothetical protein